MSDEATIVYRNHRGEVAERTIIPRSIVHGVWPDHGPDPCWMVIAFCKTKGAERHFKLEDILEWKDGGSAEARAADEAINRLSSRPQGEWRNPQVGEIIEKSWWWRNSENAVPGHWERAAANRVGHRVRTQDEKYWMRPRKKVHKCGIMCACIDGNPPNMEWED